MFKSSDGLRARVFVNRRVVAAAYAPSLTFQVATAHLLPWILETHTRSTGLSRPSNISKSPARTAAEKVTPCLQNQKDIT